MLSIFLVDNVLHLLKRKVYKLMKGYFVEMKPALIKRNKEEYHADFLASRYHFEATEDEDQQAVSQEQDLLQENKTMANIPNRKQIKAASAKYLEDMAKKNDE